MGKILDCWFARTSLGRAAVLSFIPMKALIQSMRGNIALPTFWRQALAALRELPLTLTNLSTDGALSQPIWDNLHFPPPSISQQNRDRWESLQVTVLHNLYSDREGKVAFTRKDNENYIDIENNCHYFRNEKINNERFLISWEVTVKHTKEHIQPFLADKPRKPKAKEPGEPDSVRITTSVLYIHFIGGTPYEGIPNALGELAKGEELTDDMDDLDLDPSPRARWGKGYKGPRREAFPLPDEYSFDDEYTPLDATTVKILTSLFSKQQTHKPHPSLAAWEKRLRIKDKQWDIIASRYNSSLLTPRDYHLHFKHITHRRIATNNRSIKHLPFLPPIRGNVDAPRPLPLPHCHDQQSGRLRANTKYYSTTKDSQHSFRAPA
jgi:hypothetical protein